MDHLNTTKCECGHVFTANDIKPPLLKVPDHRTYGGIVKRQSETQCECGKRYRLWLKPEHNTYTVKTISSIDDEKLIGDGITDDTEVIKSAVNSEVIRKRGPRAGK